MSLEIGRFTPSLAAVQRPDERGGRRDTDVPASPPAEVRTAVRSAAERAAELAAENRELHFRKDEASGRIVIEVRDLEGHVLRVIPPSRALEIISGASI